MKTRIILSMYLFLW